MKKENQKKVKVGDWVEVGDKFGPEWRGTGIVKHVYDDGNGIFLIQVNGDVGGFFINDFELSPLNDTPLMKALR